MHRLPDKLKQTILSRGITELRPAQAKAVEAGLHEGKNLLICTPTASGKTLSAEIAMLSAIHAGKGRCVYVVPLKALASEKFRQFRQGWPDIRVGISTGDLDKEDHYLANYDIVICTAEKLDSLIRHKSPVATGLAVAVIDEIHLMEDAGRGPVLEMVITLLRIINPGLQIVGLSATIGNPKELAAWLQAELIEDSWRPVELRKGVWLDGYLAFEGKRG